MSDTWLVPGGSVAQENEDGGTWLIPGSAVINEAAAAGISIPLLMQQMNQFDGGTYALC